MIQSILLAITILSTVWIGSNAASSRPPWSSRPSLLKRQFHSLSRRRQQQDTTISTTVDHHNIPTGNDDNNSDILNAVFCVRGGGANGPCIGIDLGKFMVDILCSVDRWLALS